MKSLIRHWRSLTGKAAETDRQYGWLFPVLAPFMVLAVVLITLSVPLVSHWRAIEYVDRAGGGVQMESGKSAWLGVLPDSLLRQAAGVEVTRAMVNDELIAALVNIRGAYELCIIDGGISREHFNAIHRQRPDIRVIGTSLGGRYREIANEFE